LIKTSFKKLHQLTLLLLILTTITITISILPHASAQMVMYQVNPSSGPVGTVALVSANVTTTNGTYSIYFDDRYLTNGTAIINSADSNITIPDASSGVHIIKIVDQKTGENATNTFTVTTAYSIDIPTNKTFQEGNSVPVRVNVTGGDASINQTGTITITPPTQEQYTQTVTLPVSDLGNATTTLTYPNDFSAAANTSYYGTYTASFNSTIANTTFAVQLANATQYHRNQTVNIKALYGPSELVTLTITGNDIDIQTNTSDPTGLINYNWTVPTTAAIGTYNVNLVAVNTAARKTILDNQDFTIPGFPVNVTARNLANETVASITIQAYENNTLTTSGNTTTTGAVTLYLEIGSFSCQAYYQNVLLGEQDVQVNDTTAFDITCNLTNLGIKVIANINGAKLEIPEVGVLLSPYNNTYTSDLNGSVIIHSLLPNQTYSLNLTRYGNSFNITPLTNLLINNTTQPWYNITIPCPNLNLQINVTKANGQPFDNALVKAQDLEGAPIFQGNTDTNGQINFTAPFGRYRIQVLGNNQTVLNETTTDLFINNATTIPCDLYGLTLTVQILDYFGQGISAMNVQVQSNAQQQVTGTTTADGKVIFNNLVGGTLQVTVYSNDQSTPLVGQGIDLQSSTTLKITISKYVMVAGTLMDTGQLATIAIILIIVVILLIAEIYRRQRTKPMKTETEETEPERAKPQETETEQTDLTKTSSQQSQTDSPNKES
jgi:hypothetical protein